MIYIFIQYVIKLCGLCVIYCMCQQRLQARQGDEQDLVAAVLDFKHEIKTKYSGY